MKPWPGQSPAPEKVTETLRRTDRSNGLSPAARMPPTPKRPGFVLGVEGLSLRGQGCRTPQTLLGKEVISRPL